MISEWGKEIECFVTASCSSFKMMVLLACCSLDLLVDPFPYCRVGQHRASHANTPKVGVGVMVCDSPSGEPPSIFGLIIHEI